MPPEPVPADPGWDEDLAWLDRDPVSAAEREAWLDRLCQLDDDPCDGPQEYWDPQSCVPPPGEDELTAEELAGAAEAAADEMLALDAASTGRRGPGQAGSARVFPGESASRAAGFGTGMAWDVTPGCAQLAVAADAAVDGRDGGDRSGDWFGGVADHELAGLICAWDRVEAHAAARKLAAVAEVFRRNPEDGFEPGPGQMPAVVHEFTRDQLACALGESRAAADWLLTVAWHLATRLAGTLGALAGGVITKVKAELIVRLTCYLSDEEARAVEAAILGRAGRLTPGGLRSALARAVLEAAPETARERRKTAARFARVERWAEDSGNAALMGRELPPDEVLACDQRICWWAGELKNAGLDGGMDELRARAFLDLVLGKDSRPRPDGTAAPAASDSTGTSDSSGSDSTAGQDPGDSTAGQDPGDSTAGQEAGGRASSGSGGSANAGGNSDGGGSAGSANAGGNSDGGSSASGGSGGGGSGGGGGVQQPPGAGPAGGPGNGGAGGFAGRVTLTVPLGTAAGLTDRPGELGGHGPVDPWLARDLANAAAANPKTTWCVTVTDQHGHAVGHGCARPEPKSHRKRAGPGPPPGAAGFTFTPAGRDGPPGGYGTWRLRTPGGGPDLIVAIDSVTTDPCEHQYQARGHDPGVRLRHLSQVRHASCTSPVCRRAAAQCDFEHNVPFEAGGRTCLCNAGPKCRHDHRLKQQPGWKVDQLPDGTFRWTTPAGRSYDTEPTRYPI